MTRRRRNRLAPPPPMSWVYFAQVGPYIKVGFSRNPEQRVRRLFSSATEPPPDTPRGIAHRRLLRTVPGDLSAERGAHTALDDFRVKTEWYLDEPEVRAFIETFESGQRDRVVRPAGVYEPPMPPQVSAEALAQLAAFRTGRVS